MTSYEETKTTTETSFVSMGPPETGLDLLMKTERQNRTEHFLTQRANQLNETYTNLT